MKTFTWRVEKGASLSCEFAVRTVQFGDGYEQRQPKSLRGALQKWAVTVSGHADTVMAARDFLTEHAGVQAFWWTSPDARAIRVKCAKYDVKHQGGKVFVLSCEFEEVM